MPLAIFQPDGPPPEPPRIDVPRTVGEVVSLYLRNTAAEQHPRTYADRRRILDAFVAVHGQLPLTEAKPYHLRLWVDSQEKWRSDWSKKAAVGAVQRALNWALKLGIVDRNPFFGVSHREGDPGRSMTDAEFFAMLRSSSAPFRRVLVFLRMVGCRPCELSSLEPSHIDLDQGTATLRDHKTARTQRTRRPRSLILHSVAIKLVRYLLRTMVAGQVPLFINCRGRRWTRYALASRIKRLRKKLKLPADCKLYGLRYALACRALRTTTIDLKTLSVILGHTTVRMTQRYAQIDGDLDHLRDSVERIFRKPEK